MKLELKEPIEIGTETITTLVFRERVVSGDLRGIKMSGFSDMLIDDVLKIAGRLSSQTDVVMQRLGLEDLSRVLEVVGGFLERGPTESPPTKP